MRSSLMVLLVLMFICVVHGPAYALPPLPLEDATAIQSETLALHSPFDIFFDKSNPGAGIFGVGILLVFLVLEVFLVFQGGWLTYLGLLLTPFLVLGMFLFLLM